MIDQGSGGSAAARQAFEAFYATKGLERRHHRERKEWLRVRGAALDL